jgi:hypothetical protein
MRIKPKKLLLFLISLLALISGRVNAQQSPALVEVWCGGGDGLTLRLRDAVEQAFSTSPDFQMSNGKLAGTLLVTIPNGVGWKQSGKRTRLSYKIELSVVGGKDLGKRTGSCWDDDLQSCSKSILSEVRDAVDPPQNLRVADEETAIRFAEKALINVYGRKQIEGERPYHAVLRNGIWHVTGTLHCPGGGDGCVGGTAMADVSQRDGRVMHIIHTK